MRTLTQTRSKLTHVPLVQPLQIYTKTCSQNHEPKIFTIIIKIPSTYGNLLRNREEVVKGNYPFNNKQFRYFKLFGLQNPDISVDSQRDNLWRRTRKLKFSKLSTITGLIPKISFILIESIIVSFIAKKHSCIHGN